MHFLEGITLEETDDGLHAIIITLRGEVSSEMEQILRLEFDKTLVKERKGGVIIDLTDIDSISAACMVRMLDFNRHLERDSIRCILVVGDVADEALRGVGLKNKFRFVGSLEDAKRWLGISE